MKHLPLIIILAGLGLVWYNNTTTTAERNQLATSPSGYNRQLVREHVIELPEDGDRWETIVVADERTPLGRDLVASFITDQRLASLTTQSKYYVLRPDHWWVQMRLAGQPTPAVIVQQPLPANNGAKRVYHAYGPSTPVGSILADEIQQSLDAVRASGQYIRAAQPSQSSLGGARLYASGPCPGPGPCPVPGPTPGPVGPVTPMLEVRPNVIGPVDNNTLSTILIVAGGLAGAYTGYKKKGTT